MNDRFKFRVYVTENDAYPEKVGYVNTEDFYIHPDGEESYFNADYDFAESVIEQCTGLKDKNGKLIYEGDIVKGKATIGEGNFEYLGCIKWYYQSELIGWYVENKDGGAWELKQIHAKISADNITGEVIGNIHENADLLGEE